MAKGHPTIRPPNLDPDLLNVPSPDSEKSSRAASSLLANLWQYSKLHRDFRAVCSTEPGNRDLGRAVQCKVQITGGGGAHKPGIQRQEAQAMPRILWGRQDFRDSKGSPDLSVPSPLQKGYRKEDFLGP